MRDGAQFQKKVIVTTLNLPICPPIMDVLFKFIAQCIPVNIFIAADLSKAKIGSRKQSDDLIQ